MFFPPPGGATEYIAYRSVRYMVFARYDNPGYLYPGPYAERTKSQLTNMQNTQHFTSLKRGFVLPST